MYIRKAEIVNIKGIKHFEMDFSPFSKAGWHVLIGDNGSGKTTILRGIGMVLLGAEALPSLDLKQGALLRLGEQRGSVTLKLEYNPKSDKVGSDDVLGLLKGKPNGIPRGLDSANLHFPEVLMGRVEIRNEKETHILNSKEIERRNDGSFEVTASDALEAKTSGFFACGYGPVRRLAKNGNVEKATRHDYFATLFGDKQHLSSAWEWIRKLGQDAEKSVDAQNTIDLLVELVNKSKLIPDGAELTGYIDARGIRFRDPEENLIYLEEGSDGYRSVIGLVLDIVRNMVDQYGIDKVKEHHRLGAIHLPGVVLIDEVDAHLHPDWQVRLGDRFTSTFPLVQFIVTTHSPLVCRGCGDTGWIWHLRKPGSEEDSGPVTLKQRNQLVYGDVLDAFDSGTFGQHQSSETSVRLRERMAVLHQKSIRGVITSEERGELQDLQSFL